MTSPHSKLIVLHWQAWMRAQSWSERTVMARVELVTRVARQHEVEPQDLETVHVMDFLASARIASTSRQTYYASLRCWFRWLVDEGHRDVDPMDRLPKPKAGRRTARYLNNEHMRHLFSTRMHRRTRLMILLGAYQGFRVTETAKAHSDDFDMIGRTLHVVGKGDVEAVLPLHPIVAAAVGDAPRGWLFPQWTANAGSPTGGHVLGSSVSRIVGDAMRRAGIPGTAHSLRHWHATELLAAGVDTRITQELMRHASIATTQLYTHVTERQQREGLLLLPDVTSSAPASREAAGRDIEGIAA